MASEPLRPSRIRSSPGGAISRSASSKATRGSLANADDVAHPARLVPDCRDDVGMGVAKVRRGKARGQVDELVPVRVDDRGTMGLGNDERVVRAPGPRARSLHGPHPFDDAARLRPG